MRGLAVALLLAGPAFGQDAAAPADTSAGAPYDESIVPACLTGRLGLRDRSNCIGVAAAQCLDRLPEVAEAMSFASCFTAEEAQWAARLTEALASYQDSMAMSDRAEGVAPGTGRVDRLHDAQAAWEAYRDAECELQRRAAEGGAGEPVPVAACRMTLTGMRALGVEQDRLSLDGA